jgi:hypothetical protein
LIKAGGADFALTMRAEEEPHCSSHKEGERERERERVVVEVEVGGERR